MSKFVAALLVLLALVGQAFAQAPQLKEQVWVGKLSVGGTQLTTILHVFTDPAGKLTATVDVVEQGAKGIPCSSVSLDSKALKFAVESLGATYEGKLSADGKTATGTFRQGGAELDLVMTVTDKSVLAEPRRPQTPKKPYPYAEEEVAYPNASAKITLAGTLTKPTKGGPFPAVILITGSGAQDRDESLMGHKPFLVLADYLTRRGIAVLRVDDRGVGKSTGSMATATTKDFATDVEAGIAFLKKRKDVDARRIGLIGHSEGGLIAPMVAARNKDVAFIVMMAGPGVDGEKIILEQTQLISKAAGMPAKALADSIAQSRKVFGIVRSESSPEKARTAVEEFLKAEAAKQPKPPGMSDATIATQIRIQAAQVTSPWFRFFLTYDPRPALAKVKVPVLAVNGSLDLQVPPLQSFPEIEKALKLGRNKRFVVRSLPGLNHLFQTCKTGSPGEYAQIEETMSPVALKVIGDWVVHVAKVR